jgi:hypothetical protein
MAKCKIEDCTGAAEYGGLCFYHAKHREWQDNSNPDDLGIVRFAYDVLPERFDPKFGTPWFHQKMLAELIRARMSPEATDKYDRMHLYALPREHSKSTIGSFLWVLYCIAYGLVRFALITSDSDAKAQQFIRAIRSALRAPRFREFFGNMNPMSVEHSIDREANKWSQNHLVTSTGIHIVSMGIGQSARGLLEDVGRPDLVIGDDIESEANTKTPEARAKNWDWWRKQIVPATDLKRGQIIYIGTMLHEDCILGKLMSQDNRYMKHFYQVVNEPDDPEERKKPLWEWPPLWPEKFDPDVIKKIYDDYVSDEQKGLDQFYCEYMNIAVAPQNRRFGQSSIVEDDFEFWVDVHGRKWLKYKGETYNCETVLGVDPAISESETAAWTVILAMATIPSGLHFILDYRRGRYDVRKDLDSGREGTIDNIVDMVYEFWPLRIGFEVTGIGMPIFRELIRELRSIERKNEHFRVPQLIPIDQVNERHKDDRIIAVLSGPHKKRQIIQRASHAELKHEQTGFPKTRWKDCLDAEANAKTVAVRPHMTIPYSIYRDISKGVYAEEDDDYGQLDWQMP